MSFELLKDCHHVLILSISPMFAQIRKWSTRQISSGLKLTETVTSNIYLCWISYIFFNCVSSISSSLSLEHDEKWKNLRMVRSFNGDSNLEQSGFNDWIVYNYLAIWIVQTYHCFRGKTVQKTLQILWRVISNKFTNIVITVNLMCITTILKMSLFHSDGKV